MSPELAKMMGDANFAFIDRDFNKVKKFPPKIHMGARDRYLLIKWIKNPIVPPFFLYFSIFFYIFSLFFYIFFLFFRYFLIEILFLFN